MNHGSGGTVTVAGKPADIVFWLIPSGTILSCDTCGTLWLLTAAEIISSPREPARCPACSAVKCNPDGADVPHIVKG
jgi:hypothetical protein